MGLGTSVHTMTVRWMAPHTWHDDRREIVERRVLVLSDRIGKTIHHAQVNKEPMADDLSLMPPDFRCLFLPISIIHDATYLIQPRRTVSIE